MNHYVSLNKMVGIGTGLLLLGILLGALTGCAATPGLVPAIGGRTSIERSFVDVDGTNYSEAIKAPAGVDVAGLSQFGYEWNADGSGKIGIESEGDASTQGQALMNTELGLATNAMMTAVMTAAIQAVLQAYGLHAGIPDTPEGPRINPLTLQAIIEGLRAAGVIPAVP